MTGNRKLKIVYPTREAVQWDRPSPKVKRMDRDNSQYAGHLGRGGYKSAFVNMRNTVIGNYQVEDYLFAEDHPGLDEQDGYSNHYWSVTCTVCGTDAILERRQIRGKQRMCPVCKERATAEAKAVALTRKRRKRTRVEQRAKIEADTVKACMMFDAGNPTKLIADVLGLQAPHVCSLLKTTGRKPQARYIGHLKSDAAVRAPEVRKRQLERQREYSLAYHAKKRAEVVAADPDKEIINGRVRLTEEAKQRRKELQKERQKERNHERYWTDEAYREASRERARERRERA